MQKNTLQSPISRKIRIFLRRNYAMLIALPLLVLVFFYACFIEPDLLRTTAVEFQHEAVAPALDGVKIVFVSDLHMRSNEQNKLRELVNQINQLNPDLILLGGDFVNGSGDSMAITDLLNELQQLSAPLGVYAVPGNHEYRRGFDDIYSAFCNSKIRMLIDQNVSLRTANGGAINLIGLDYQINPAHRQNTERLKKLFSDNNFNLVFTHTPEDFAYLSSKAHLTLAGHTHGGQVNIPFFGSIINPAFGRNLNYGIKKSGSKTMFVSGGISSAYQTCRLAMLPEIVVITLKSGNKN